MRLSLACSMFPALPCPEKSKSRLLTLHYIKQNEWDLFTPVTNKLFKGASQLVHVEIRGFVLVAVPRFR